MTRPVKLCGILAVLAACSGSSSRAAPEVDPSGWRCYARDPKEPALPQGDVTYTRNRYVEGRLELESINNQGGMVGVTRLVLAPAGDHLEATLRGVKVTVKLDTPDGQSWTLSYSDPASGLAFEEKNTVNAGVLTVVSTELGGEGSGQVTAVRYLPTACSIVVAELAKYPPAT